MSTLLTRRQLTALLAAAPIPALPLGPALAQSALDIRRGSGFQPIPSAITNFQGDGGAQATQILTTNFRRSVFLKPLDPGTFLEKATNPEAPQIEPMAFSVHVYQSGRSSKYSSRATRTASVISACADSYSRFRRMSVGVTTTPLFATVPMRTLLPQPSQG